MGYNSSINIDKTGFGYIDDFIRIYKQETSLKILRAWKGSLNAENEFGHEVVTKLNMRSPMVSFDMDTFSPDFWADDAIKDGVIKTPIWHFTLSIEAIFTIDNATLSLEKQFYDSVGKTITFFDFPKPARLLKKQGLSVSPESVPGEPLKTLDIKGFSSLYGVIQNIQFGDGGLKQETFGTSSGTKSAGLRHKMFQEFNFNILTQTNKEL